MLGEAGSGSWLCEGHPGPHGDGGCGRESLRVPWGRGLLLSLCLRPLPGLGAEGNGSVKSRCGGNRPHVSLGESRVERKNMSPFPSPFFTSLFLSRIISANRGKSKFTKNYTFSLKISLHLFFPLVLRGWGIPPITLGVNWGVCQQFWGRGCELLLPSQSLAGGEGYLVLWGSPPPS